MELKTSQHISETQGIERSKFFTIYKDCPIPDNEILSNLGLFLRRQLISKILYMDELYKKIVNVPGVVIEFGTRWGQNLALFESFRGLYEPFNQGREIIGFDTFSGFPTIGEKDGNNPIATKGAFSVTDGYEKYLEQVLDYHEQEAPMAHIKKYKILKGDAPVVLNKFLTEHPETIIALAYFDFDLYEPTKNCIELIKNHVVKGSVLGFDELHLKEFPGETIALREVLGLASCRLVRSSYAGAYQSYMIIDGEGDF